MTLELSLIVDSLLLLLSLGFILKVSDASIFNPSLWWVALHAYVVTFRLITLNLGVEPLPFLGIRSDLEMINAATASDISLLAVVAATLFVAREDLAVPRSVNDAPAVELDVRLGQLISILCLIIGTYFLVKFGYSAIIRARGTEIFDVDIGGFELSSYPIFIAGFAIQGALIQVAIYGFAPLRFAMLLVLLALSSICLSRFAFLLSAVMAFLIFQTRQNKVNIPAKWLIVFAALSAIWFVYKPVAAAINEDDSFSQIVATAQGYVDDVLSGSKSGDTNFLDMQATYMAAADEAGRRFYGASALPLLYLPIPRFMWPEKPRMNQFAVEITSLSRPIVQTGITPQLSGEAYVNFGWIGCAFVPFLYIWAMQTGYRRVRSYGILSAARWIYLVFLVSMVQVFRDGLGALVIFGMVAFLPMFGWGVLSQLLRAAAPRVGNHGLRHAVADGTARSGRGRG
jgi:hypothetical protein